MNRLFEEFWDNFTNSGSQPQENRLL